MATLGKCGGQKPQAYEKEDYFSEQFRIRNEDSIDAYYRADRGSFMGRRLLDNQLIVRGNVWSPVIFKAFYYRIPCIFILYSRRFLDR